jgi:hypothetical protein
VFQTHMVLKTLNKINSKGLFRLRTFTENWKSQENRTVEITFG